jgi:hypothetical protein
VLLQKIFNVNVFFAKPRLQRLGLLTFQQCKHVSVALRVPSGSSFKATSRIFVVRGKGSGGDSAMELAKFELGLLNVKCFAEVVSQVSILLLFRHTTSAWGYYFFALKAGVLIQKPKEICCNLVWENKRHCPRKEASLL